MRTVRQYLQTTVSVPFKVIVLKTNQLTFHSFIGDLYIVHRDIISILRSKFSFGSVCELTGEIATFLIFYTESLVAFICQLLMFVVFRKRDGEEFVNRRAGQHVRGVAGAQERLSLLLRQVSCDRIDSGGAVAYSMEKAK